MVDEKMLRMGLDAGMKAVVCAACHEMTFYNPNPERTNTPTNCGMIPCLRKMKDSLARYDNYGPTK